MPASAAAQTVNKRGQTPFIHGATPPLPLRQ
jgi:hypothetical protein